MPVKSGNCVKTGARVLVLDYGYAQRADIFLLGDTIIINFGAGIFDGHQVREREGYEYQAIVGQEGFYHEGKNVLVIPKWQFQGEIIHQGGCKELCKFGARPTLEERAELADVQRITAAMAAEVERWCSNALMLEQANAGLAQLNGKLRAELADAKSARDAYGQNAIDLQKQRDALRAELAAVKGQEAVGEVQLKTGGGISLLHVELTQPLPPGTKLYASPI
jgi:hypothetical protein